VFDRSIGLTGVGVLKGHSRSCLRVALGPTAVLLALVTAGVVWAASPGKEKVALTAAGNRQAKAEVLRRADLGKGWSGGAKKPDLSSTMPCSWYHPKQSDLVVVGAAETTWQKSELEIDSEAEVLRTAKMVRLDWHRTVVARQVMLCLRQGFAKEIGSSGKLVSFARVAFPHLARHTRAFRAVAKVKTGGGTVLVEFDFVAVGVRANELTLTLSGPAAKKPLHAELVRLTRRLASRMR
jgi:hypothetical protein